MNFSSISVSSNVTIISDIFGMILRIVIKCCDVLLFFQVLVSLKENGNTLKCLTIYFPFAYSELSLFYWWVLRVIYIENIEDG